MIDSRHVHLCGKMINKTKDLLAIGLRLLWAEWVAVTCVVRSRCPEWCPGVASCPGWCFPKNSSNDKLWNGILWPPDVKSCLHGKDPDDGKGWGQEEKEATEDEMVGWHHRLNGHESGQTPKNSGGHRSLACCSPWSGRVRQDLVTKQQQYFFAHHSECMLCNILKFLLEYSWFTILVSGVNQSGSAIHIHISTLFLVSFRI